MKTKTKNKPKINNHERIIKKWAQNTNRKQIKQYHQEPVQSIQFHSDKTLSKT